VSEELNVRAMFRTFTETSENLNSLETGPDLGFSGAVGED
jgi:hypothetical protein